MRCASSRTMRDQTMVCSGEPDRSRASPSYVFTAGPLSLSISFRKRFLPLPVVSAALPFLPPAAAPFEPWPFRAACAAFTLATVRAPPCARGAGACAAFFPLASLPLAVALAVALAAAFTFAFAFAIICLPILPAAFADGACARPPDRLPRTTKSMRRSMTSPLRPVLSRPRWAQSSLSSGAGSSARRSRLSPSLSPPAPALEDEDPPLAFSCSRCETSFRMFQ
mmetsp:Transcript_75797/g.195308  ORF Transcript_75797/g.195308 Transcript_75797/m.195308 type:complete len:224 (-) Transcript_75797:1250-1921(-)